MPNNASTSVKLFHCHLSYSDGLVVQTAASGHISTLSALYLTIDRDGEEMGFGEIRENISFLTGVPEAELRSAILALCNTLDWALDPEDILEQLSGSAFAPKPAKALFDSALHDWMARRDGKALSTYLGGSEAPGAPSNQSLFWSDFETFQATADRLVGLGFRDLKLRVGIGNLDQDLRRLAHLRDSYGSKVRLSVDANGGWTLPQAQTAIAAFEPFDLKYVEQPLPPGDWDGVDVLTDQVPMPIFLDESVKDENDIAQLLRRKGRVGAHLKIVKMGGIGPVAAAGRRLMEAGVPVMVGQMNEGAAATAAAAHIAVALNARSCELYGAMGLANDPVSGLSYDNGFVNWTGRQGLGVALDRAGLTRIH